MSARTALDRLRQEMWVVLSEVCSGYLAGCSQSAAKRKPSCDPATQGNSGIFIDSPSSNALNFQVHYARHCYSLGRSGKGDVSSTSTGKKVDEARIRSLKSGHAKLKSMAGPCCGSVGNLDVLEGNLVPISRKKKNEQSSSFGNSTELTTRDQAVGLLTPHEKSAAVLCLQPLNADKAVRKKTSVSCGCLPLCISGSHQRSSVLKQKTSLKDPVSLHGPLRSGNLIKKASSTLIEDFSICRDEHAAQETNLADCKASCDGVILSRKESPKERRTENGLMLDNTSGFNDKTNVDDAAAARSSISQPEVIPVFETAKQVFLVAGRDEERMSSEKNSSSQLHVVLQNSEPEKRKGASRSCNSHGNKIETMACGLEQNKSYFGKRRNNDTEENECEVEGNVYLSSFTFGSMSHTLSFQEDGTSSILQHLEGKRLQRSQFSSDSTMARLHLENFEGRLSEKGLLTLPSATCTALTSSNYIQADLSQKKQCRKRDRLPESLIFCDEGKAIQAREFILGDSSSSVHKPRTQLDVRDLECHKISNSEPKNLEVHKNNASPISKCHCVAKRISRRATSNVLQRKKLADIGFRRRQPLERTFNLGVGIGIAFMLIGTRNEVERLNKLLERTEALVQDMKQQLQSEKGFFTDCASNSDSTKMDISEIKKEAKEHGHQKIWEESTIGLSDTRPAPKAQSITSVEHVPESIRMAELEAALQAELEMMELNVNAVEFSERTSSDDGLPNKLSKHETIEHSSLEENCNYAISPGALDRRLHEVLEARQEEQILELEAQLEATKTNLVLTEKELHCWKDIVHQLIELSLEISGVLLL